VEAQPPSDAAAGLGGDIDSALGEIRVPAGMVDRDGMFVWQNERLREILGDLLGRSVWEVVAPEVQSSDRIHFSKLVLGTARTADHPSVLVGRGGRRLTIEMHSVALRDGRRVVGVFGVADEQPETTPPDETKLTPRQREVLRELARGSSTEQIAATLHLSRETVRNHVRAVLARLGVHSRLEAVAEGRRLGLVD
jgi:PAS domain S-box-containing protein